MPLRVLPKIFSDIKFMIHVIYYCKFASILHPRDKKRKERRQENIGEVDIMNPPRH
jgi:hypothetical protein